MITIRVYIVVYRHTGISLQPYTELRNIYFNMQKKKKNVNKKKKNLYEMFKVYFSVL